jgi:hypothetical protein
MHQRSAGGTTKLFLVLRAKGQHILDFDGAGVDALRMFIAPVTTKDGSKIWVPQRAKTKHSCPDMLNSTVGGNLSSSEKPIELYRS